MKKLAKYGKPYLGVLLAAVVLLFMQAICDLRLPNYMSDIVNVGIQQNGIEHASPDAISEQGMTFLQTFMTEEEKDLLNGHYQLFSGSDTNTSGTPYNQVYPDLGDGKVWIRQETDADTLDEMDLIFGTAGWTFINTMESLAESSGQNSQETSEETDVSQMDFKKLYDMQPMLDQLPDSDLQDAREKALANDSSMRLQTGAALAGSFYTELGLELGDIQFQYISFVGMEMLVVALLGGIATILVSLISARVSAGVARDLRRDVFRKVESFSNTEFDRYSTASLITRSTNDATQIQMLLMMGIRMICYAPIMGIGGTMMALEKSTSMSWIIAVTCIVLIGMVAVIFSIAKPKFKAIQKLIDKLNLVARENLSGLMVIRAFGTRQFETDRFDAVNRDLTKTHRFVNRVMTFMMPAMMLIMNCTSVVIVWVASHQIADSQMQVGDMMAFMQYAMQIIMSFLMISMMFIMVPRAAVSGDRIAEVLSTEPVIKDKESCSHLPEENAGTVEFRDVSFRYQGADEDALEHISFVSKPGQTTAFIGATGSGKSTLVNLVPRFYDVTGGSVLVGGVDVRDLPQKELREAIGFVPQKGVLLSGTIDSNLRYGRQDAPPDQIRESAEIAQAMEFIEEKPEGFETEISQGGTNVSGGQKQRLSIARALAKKAPIYIFDDSFSALDFKTDAALRRALKGYTKNSTVLLVAQRVSTIMHADQILVLDEGRVVGKGTHKELLKTCPAYYEIASSQLSKEELE